MKHETVLITGASGGIGKELAYLFAKGGYHLVLIARDESRLQNIANELQNKYGTQATIIAKDLSNQDAVSEAYKELQEKHVQVDYLVNNAGFGLFGEFAKTDLDKELNMIDLNIKTLTHLTKLLLPGMMQRNKGGILNVASTAAFQPGPLMAVYYATKAYVLSFTEALENELKDTNIKVTALCPGPTQTEFSNRADLGASKLFKSGVMDVKQVAAIAYKEFQSGKTIVIPGLKNRILAGSIRFMPRKLVTAIVRRVQEREQ
ncbi:SDR family oxidoreductase [Ectobacillus antri]|jgi:short-subunit dehydrogenase|uniref:SDR family oxidoreductase n=1 Tax=Ectobacillus antri TaxID=2486280 RepID=A0ABT6H3Q2_9BACI|nr:SDR family oxidoreductase [Ectobacillus antri]MDG4656754.1 SDR family oxidoreductase [Ectobacillus antri]MDG5753883.1 SDR family oxidoreductase [Ectobacillus antri]